VLINPSSEPGETAMTDGQRLAEMVRAACIKAALEAYEEGGILGLCAEGRWEYAISMMQRLDLEALIPANQTDHQLLV
jgi:hypothetical protein